MLKRSLTADYEPVKPSRLLHPSHMAKRQRRNPARARKSALTRALVAANPQPSTRTLSFGKVHTFRFVCYNTAGVNNQAILTSNLLNMIGMCTAANTLRRLIIALRILKLELWAPPVTPAVTTVVAASLTWNGLNPLFKQRSDYPMGDVNAYIVSRPPKALAADLVSTEGVNESTAIFFINCPYQSILDVTVDLTMLSLYTGVNSTFSTTAAGTTGQAYHVPIDGTTGSWKCMSSVLSIT